MINYSTVTDLMHVSSTFQRFKCTVIFEHLKVTLHYISKYSRRNVCH